MHLDMNKIIDFAKLTNDFYNKTAPEFDKTRKYEWDGWIKLMEFLKEKSNLEGSVLDVACGNGRFANTIKNNFLEYFYLGIDNNKYLLEQAKKTYFEKGKIEFIEFDIYQDWSRLKKVYKKTFDLVVAFGITHHLVNVNAREKFIDNLCYMVNNEGVIVVSFWDFLGSKSLSKKVIESLGDGDYILDWKRGEIAYRYAHHYTKGEILKLFNKSNLKIIKNYSADGPNGMSNDCYILKKVLH